MKKERNQMKKVFLINGSQPYPFAPGKLNAALIEKAQDFFLDRGFEVKTTVAHEPYEVPAEVEKFKWADYVIVQMPINWMGTPWLFKKYIDEVFMAGLMGEMSNGDGRSAEAPKKNYGLGGKMTGKYMLSVTANAPKEAFNNPEEKYFAGASEDDVLLPMHLNLKWFGYQALPTFMAYDVMKNPEIENDFERFEAHLKSVFG
ncbi:MAG: NAD(P)H-dependent oxidoreductase [Ralstonia sp.]|uniref:NAD(P)H-dependent oxidoreductase n=1 Tax=Ralstonia sp. TaxID=54061 RepID=UPI003F7EA0A0